jgi:hypothetical protein
MRSGKRLQVFLPRHLFGVRRAKQIGSGRRPDAHNVDGNGPQRSATSLRAGVTDLRQKIRPILSAQAHVFPKIHTPH